MIVRFKNTKQNNNNNKHLKLKVETVIETPLWAILCMRATSTTWRLRTLKKTPHGLKVAHLPRHHGVAGSIHVRYEHKKNYFFPSNLQLIFNKFFFYIRVFCGKIETDHLFFRSGWLHLYKCSLNPKITLSFLILIKSSW